MVVVTHEMGFARQVADRIVFMADGMILEEGTPDEFFENPTNERLKQFLGKIIRKEGGFSRPADHRTDEIKIVFRRIRL